ncbi:hypothetical protein DBR22_11545 [Arthrobacter sp. HMWF013]|nr:hypothetical protein DBR22_11545 [Arthrobacter sp. HMWF013]
MFPSGMRMSLLEAHSIPLQDPRIGQPLCDKWIVCNEAREPSTSPRMLYITTDSIGRILLREGKGRAMIG